jgi:hypothetical protein
MIPHAHCRPGFHQSPARFAAFRWALPIIANVYAAIIAHLPRAVNPAPREKARRLAQSAKLTRATRLRGDFTVDKTPAILYNIIRRL